MPTGPVRNGFVVENAPAYNMRRVFKEKARRRNITVSISFDEYSSIVRTACWYCGEFTYKGYSGVDRVQNAGTYHKNNVVAYHKTCDFLKGPLSANEFLGKVKHIVREVGAKNTLEVVGGQI